jgi:polyphosphate kinase 2
MPLTTSEASARTGGTVSNHDDRLSKKAYEKEMTRLHEELSFMKDWLVEAGERLVVLFEGRDAAGKGGCIKAISQELSPRSCRIAALPKPTDRERTQWYFQRYIDQLPAAGEIVLFDRSWYNRAGVEKVMGFCTPTEHRLFLRHAPEFERMLIEDGIRLIKYWFSVSDEEQEHRFQARINNPVKQWKLSPMDLESRRRWVDYSRAKDEMFVHTDISESPWYVVESDDKRAARINCVTHLLSLVPYQRMERPEITLPRRQQDNGYVRPSRTMQREVPNHAAELMAAG